MILPPYPLNSRITDITTAPDRVGNQALDVSISQANRAQLISCSFSMTTGATVADRFPYVEQTIGGQIFWRICSSAPQTALTTIRWSFIVDAENFFSLSAGTGIIRVPSLLLSQGNEPLTFGILGGVAGDDWINIRLRFGQYLQPYNI